jgi:hypothetical protein
MVWKEMFAVNKKRSVLAVTKQNRMIVSVKERTGVHNSLVVSLHKDK